MATSIGSLYATVTANTGQFRSQMKLAELSADSFRRSQRITEAQAQKMFARLGETADRMNPFHVSHNLAPMEKSVQTTTDSFQRQELQAGKLTLALGKLAAGTGIVWAA